MKIIDQLFKSNVFSNNNQIDNNRQTAQNAIQTGNSKLNNSKVPGMDKVASMLRSINRPVSDSEVSSIEKFMESSSGNMKSKIETVEWAAEKGVEMTDKNLNAIHESLNGQMNEAEIIETLSGTKDFDKMTTKEILQKIKEDPSIPKSFKDSVEKAVKEGVPLEKAIVSAVKELVKANVELKGKTVFIEKSPGQDPCVCMKQSDLLKAVELALKGVSEGKGTFKDLLKSALKDVVGEDQLKAMSEIFFDGESDESLNTDQVIDENNEDLSQFEDEMIERLENSIDEVMSEMMRDMDQSAGAELMETASDTRFKSFIVTKITAQAIEAKETFNEVKKEIVQSLRDVEVPKTPQEKLDVKEVLSKAIEKLDNILMKSDVTLFTGMKMERDLLNMSSTLQEAKKLLGKGNVDAAIDITKNVQSKLDKMIFKPAEKNIQLMAFKNAEDLLGMKNTSMPSINWQDASPRGVLELFRDLGLNHEPELAEKVLSQEKSLDKNGDYKIKDNLKAVLMKMMENDEPDNRRAVAGAEKTLNNLTGQQLMNKLETKQDTQTLFFHVPVEAAGEVNDMKLFVNARKNGDTIDWENSSLYFSIDLKKFGETGIHLQSKDKLLSISVKNDNEKFENVMKPLVTALQKEFVDVGFKLGPVKFTKLDATKSAKDIVKPSTIDNINKPVNKNSNAIQDKAKNAKKGFDFSI